MEFKEVMGELESLGTELNRKIYVRHGAGEILFGVSFKNLGLMKKKIKKNHELSLQLWESGNADAQCLSTMIMDSKHVTKKQAESWLKEISYYLLVDLLVGNVFKKTSFANEAREQWIDSDHEYTAQAGWDLVAHAAMKIDELSDEYFESKLERIEKTIDAGMNRERHAMNNALIAIGIRNESLRDKAISASHRIGEVVIDHGETACKTPIAEHYILKANDCKKKKKK